MLRTFFRTLSAAPPVALILLAIAPVTATPSGQYITRAVPQAEDGLYVVDFTVYEESLEPPHVAGTWSRTYRIYCPTETVRNVTNGEWGEAMSASENHSEGTGVLPAIVKLTCGTPNRWQ